MGLLVKILKLVNSSFFGRPQRISNPAKAVSLLGLDIVKAIVLTCGTFDKFAKVKRPGFSMDQMWQHAYTCAVFGKIIAQNAGLDRKVTDTAFTAGLLHDIGILLIATHLPDGFSRVLKYVRQHQTTMATAEMQVIGTTHAAIGAYLLGLWGLPESIIDAVSLHHHPGRRPGRGLTPAVIIHIANAMANAGARLEAPSSIIDGIDYEYLQEIGQVANLKGWRALCAKYIQETR